MIPDREQLDSFVEALSPRPVVVVVLEPGVEVCRCRTTIREPEEQFFFDDYETLTTGMREGFGDRGWWLDTSAQTPDETAEQILAHAASRGRLEG